MERFTVITLQFRKEYNILLVNEWLWHSIEILIWIIWSVREDDKDGARFDMKTRFWTRRQQCFALIQKVWFNVFMSMKFQWHYLVGGLIFTEIVVRDCKVVLVEKLKHISRHLLAKIVGMRR